VVLATCFLAVPCSVEGYQGGNDDETLDKFKIVLGAWLVVAPLILGFAAIGAAAWIIGILVVVLSVWKLLEVSKQGTQISAF
jgi:FtsH-binding integral membrane protein